MNKERQDSVDFEEKAREILSLLNGIRYSTIKWILESVAIQIEENAILHWDDQRPSTEVTG